MGSGPHQIYPAPGIHRGCACIESWWSTTWARGPRSGFFSRRLPGPLCFEGRRFFVDIFFWLVPKEKVLLGFCFGWISFDILMTWRHPQIGVMCFFFFFFSFWKYQCRKMCGNLWRHPQNHICRWRALTRSHTKVIYSSRWVHYKYNLILETLA